MTSSPTARAGTALSPEWDRGFDEAFTELITGDRDLVRADFTDRPEPAPPPAPSAAQPESPDPKRGPAAPSVPVTEDQAGDTALNSTPQPAR